MTVASSSGMLSLGAGSWMHNLSWMRAFKEGPAQRIYEQLIYGDLPLNEGGTIDNEKYLGISPPCVYFYLGKTHERFGLCAAAYDPTLDVGLISPFDTGGLVKHIMPVAGWEPAEKQQFLKRYTWSVTELNSCLTQYPGVVPERIRDYLTDEAQPHLGGPHEVWPDRPSAAGMWNSPPNQWPAWTWECRVANQGPGLNYLTIWSCTDRQLKDIQDLEDTLTDVELSQFELLMSKFFRGGTSQLVQKLKEAA